MNEPASLDRINTRLEELERRVADLENGRRTPEAATAAHKNPSPTLAHLPASQGAGFFPVLGKAMLGIAGAYLLRALAETRWIPEALLAPFAVLYALAWLAVGARAATSFARVTYACTSALILAPMLWELTMRFKVLPSWADALALAALAVVAFWLAQAPDRAPVLRIANLAAAAMALALSIATHDNLSFLAVLLMVAALCEWSARSGRVAAARGLVTLAADLGVWMLLYLYRGPQSAHVDYPALSAFWLIAPGFLLFAVSAAGVAFAACARHARITAVETVQTVIAFLLAGSGLLFFGPEARTTIFGILCLALAAAVYAALFTFLRHGADARNRAVFAAWSVALLLAGSFLAIPALWSAAWLGVAALIATAIGVRFKILYLALHGNFLLLACALASGLFAFAYQALAGTPPGAPSWAIVFAGVCAVLCNSIVEFRGNSFTLPISYVPASVAALAAAALLAQGSIALASLGFVPGSHHIALIRSFVVCALALALAFGGSQGRRPELTHIAYAAVVLEAVKLLAEDLRHGHLAYIAASVCLFAFTLIALPKVVKKNTDPET